MIKLEERYPGAMYDALYGNNDSLYDKDEMLAKKYPKGIHSGSLHMYDDEDYTFHASVGDPYGTSKEARGAGLKMDRNGFSIRLKLW